MILSKKSEANIFFGEILAKLKNIKIKSVFALTSPFWNTHKGYRSYDSDTELYILFENDTCMVIEYYFVDSLEIELRPMTSEEQEKYSKTMIKDFFNSSNDICDHITYEKIRNESCTLDYDSVKNIKLKVVVDEYEKWIDGGINFVKPTNETFDEIKIEMNNGKSFVICPDPASDDGYIHVWSEDSPNIVRELN